VPRNPRHDNDTNQAAYAPDGTPGSSKDTMASRAVDKTLGTDINGANPGRKSQDALDAVDGRGLAGPFPAFRA